MHPIDHKPMSRLLRVRDVATELAVSESHAYELMRAMDHVKLGRSLRVTPEALSEYIRCNTCSGSISVGIRGGARSTSTASVSGSRRGAATSAQRKRAQPLSSDEPLIRPTQPRTKRHLPMH